MRKAALFVLILSLVLSGASQAQDYKGRSRLYGVVCDEEGNPVEGVTVKLFSQIARQGFEIKTDKNGKWTALWIRGGAWKLDFLKNGYEPQTQVINVSSYGQNPELVVSLKTKAGQIISGNLGRELEKGNDFYNQGQYARALEIYFGLLEESPDLSILHLNIGNCYFQMEDYNRAEEHYRMTLASDKDNIAAIQAIGNCFQNRGDVGQALEWYRKIPFEKIVDSTVLYNIGVNFFNSTEQKDALKYFKRAFEIDESNLDALYQLGLTYLTLDNRTESILAFEKYLEKDPDSEKANQVRGFLEYLRK